MQFGWQTVSDETYYFQQDGTAATGSVTIQGSEYNFQKEGVLLHGWSNDGKSYYDEKGNKTSTNWVEENGSIKCKREPVAIQVRMIFPVF